MSDKQEFYAATVEEAVSRASAALSIARDQIEFEVVDGGSGGFLGLGARDARILVNNPGARPGDTAAGGDEPHMLESFDNESGLLVGEQPEGTPSVESSDAPAVEAPYELIVSIDEFMTALIEAMGFDATVDAYDAGDAIVVDVATRETGLFIGQKGETIDAVQYLLNVAVYKDQPFSKRIIVDAEGYRKRRVEAIQGMAHRTARRALRERRSLSLPPMSPAERRIVHLFFKENPNITTFSDGRDEDRRVIVSPR
jgi:spoIIIJ-associated protein